MRDVADLNQDNGRAWVKFKIKDTIRQKLLGINL